MVVTRRQWYNYLFVSLFHDTSMVTGCFYLSVIFSMVIVLWFLWFFSTYRLTYSFHTTVLCVARNWNWSHQGAIPLSRCLWWCPERIRKRRQQRTLVVFLGEKKKNEKSKGQTTNKHTNNIIIMMIITVIVIDNSKNDNNNNNNNNINNNNMIRRSTLVIYLKYDTKTVFSSLPFEKNDFEKLTSSAKELVRMNNISKTAGVLSVVLVYRTLHMFIFVQPMFLSHDLLHAKTCNHVTPSE